MDLVPIYRHFFICNYEDRFLMIKSLLGSEAAGHYSVAVSLADVVYIFQQRLLFSFFSCPQKTMFGYGGVLQKKGLYIYISALMALIVGVSMVVGPYVVPGLFGSDYVASIQPVSMADICNIGYVA